MERVIKKFRDRRNLRGRDWGAFCLKYQSELQFLSQSAVTALAPEHIRPHSEQFQAIVLLSLSFGELICPGLAYRSDKRSVGAWNVVCSAWPTSQVLSGKTFIVFYGIHRGYPVTWIQVWQTVTRETLQAAWRWVGLTDAAWTVPEVGSETWRRCFSCVKDLPGSKKKNCPQQTGLENILTWYWMQFMPVSKKPRNWMGLVLDASWWWNFCVLMKNWLSLRRSMARVFSSG